MVEFKNVPGRYPTDEEMASARQKADVDHVETTYGNFWSTYLHKNSKYYLEFDIGHFSSKFVAGEITESKYIALKGDFSLFEKIRNAVDLKMVIEK